MPYELFAINWTLQELGFFILKFDDIHYLWRLAHVYKKTFEIGKIALEEGADVEFVSKTTGLNINQIKE